MVLAAHAAWIMQDQYNQTTMSTYNYYDSSTKNGWVHQPPQTIKSFGMRMDTAGRTASPVADPINVSIYINTMSRHFERNVLHQMFVLLSILLMHACMHSCSTAASASSAAYACVVIMMITK